MKSNTNPSAKAGQALVRSGVAAVKDSRYPGGEGGQTPTGEGAPTREMGSQYARGEGDQALTGEGASTREMGSRYARGEGGQVSTGEGQQERAVTMTLYFPP